MAGSSLIDGFLFQVTENGETQVFVTNASTQVISDRFLQEHTIAELLTAVREEGYQIDRVQVSVRLDYDELN